MAAKALTPREREEIRAGIENGRTNIEIGRLLGRDRRTIGAEISRNGGRVTYSACAAQARANDQRRRPRPSKLTQDSKLCTHVEHRLRLGDSPMTISIELARGINGMTRNISHECIYQAVYDPSGPLLIAAKECLRLRRRRRKQRGTVAKNSDRLADSRSISQRPNEGVDDRSEVGHLEGDLVVGAMNQSAILTLIDRSSRRLWIAHVDSKSADDVASALIKVLKTIPIHLRRTLTWDRGAEIGNWQQIEEETGFIVYVAEPRSPWQRGSNEHVNGMIRRYLAKGTDLNLITKKRLRWIETRINSIPRRSLNWATAIATYNPHVTPTS